MNGGCGSHGCDGYGNLAGDGPPLTCLLCGRKRPVPDRVCATCRQRVQEWIADVPSLYRRLDVELVPGQGAGEKVSTSSPGSRTAATLAALSLRGTSQRLAQPGWRRRPDWTPEEADLSIPEWVGGWAGAWRRRHAHHRPSLVDAHPGVVPELPPAPQRPSVRDGQGKPLPWPEIRAARERHEAALREWQAARERAAAEGGRVVLGLGAAPKPADRPDDPQEQRLTHRYGQALEGFALGTGCGYLAVWFDRACDDDERHPDIGGFIDGLRCLGGAARAVLGEADRGDWYCGRCPATLKTLDDEGREVESPCGADLWKDADESVSRIYCRRCHRTDVHRNQFLPLRAAQLEIWSEEELVRPRLRRSSLPRPPRPAAQVERPYVDVPAWVV